MNKKWLKISREEKFEDFYELDKKVEYSNLNLGSEFGISWIGL